MYEICGVWGHVCVCVCVDVICCMCWYRRHSQSHRQSVFTTAASINLSSFINLRFFLLRDPGSLGADTSVHGCLRGRAELKGSRGTQCDMPRLIITTLCWLTGKMGQSKTRPGGRIWLWTSSVLAFCNGNKEALFVPTQCKFCREMLKIHHQQHIIWLIKYPMPNALNLKY